MRPEAKAHIDRAHDLLRRADLMQGLVSQDPLAAEESARAAYYAVFHAAKALIVERTGANQKKHGSVHNAFADVTTKDTTVDPTLRRFLFVSYEYKRIADYGTDPSERVSPAKAQAAVTEAKRFVTTVDALLHAGAS